MDETPEQRRERLKAIAKERVERLVAGESTQPHLDIPENRILSDDEAAKTKADILKLGAVQFQIRTLSVSVIKNTVQPDERYTQYVVTVDNLALADILIYAREQDIFMFSVPSEMRQIVGDKFVSGKTPYGTLFKVIGERSFQRYIEGARKTLEDAKLRNELIISRIFDETVRFKEVLIRKFRQMAYIDEYETLEIDRFVDEVKRFVAKRLPDEPSDISVQLIVDTVTKWASEEPIVETAFTTDMSPTDYERFCADAFAKAGWTANLTKASGDQGADIVCEANGRRLVVQCKLYSGSVGNAAVQEVIAAREFEYADLAAVVSNATYTASARVLASTAGVLLLHHDQIASVRP